MKIRTVISSITSGNLDAMLQPPSESTESSGFWTFAPVALVAIGLLAILTLGIVYTIACLVELNSDQEAETGWEDGPVTAQSSDYQADTDSRSSDEDFELQRHRERVMVLGNGDGYLRRYDPEEVRRWGCDGNQRRAAKGTMYGSFGPLWSRETLGQFEDTEDEFELGRHQLEEGEVPC